MQRVTSRMAQTIEQMYDSCGLLRIDNVPNNRVINYSLNNKYSMFFRVSTQGNRIELPIFAKRYISHKLTDLFISGIRKDVIIPFYTGYSCLTFRTANALIRNLVYHTSNTAGMYIGARTNKGEEYYGCAGTIFDKNMIPLFLNVIECDVEGENNRSILVYRKVKSYVHPSVFYSGGIVEKCIVNKIIPYVLQEGVSVHVMYATDNINYNAGEGRTIPEIVIADIGDKFFCKTVAPRDDYSNDDINDMLDRNIEDVFRVMKI